MKVKINITAPGLESAINNLATAISGGVQMSPTIVNATGAGQVAAPADNNEKESPAAEGMTPAQKQKAELSKQIIALGGTPPESGAVKKFQETIDELKAAQEMSAKDVPAEHEETSEEPAAEATEAPTDSAGGPTLEEVRMLAGYVVKNRADDDEKCTLGKTKVKACLKKVGAESITALFETSPEKALEFVKLLEGNAGKTLSEVVAETTAE